MWHMACCILFACLLLKHGTDNLLHSEAKRKVCFARVAPETDKFWPHVRAFYFIYDAILACLIVRGAFSSDSDARILALARCACVIVLFLFGRVYAHLVDEPAPNAHAVHPDSIHLIAAVLLSTLFLVELHAVLPRVEKPAVD
jgi:hypothetical protein